VVLDEIPSSYKDIDEVMANQADLVEVVHTLKAVLRVKGIRRVAYRQVRSSAYGSFDFCPRSISYLFKKFYCRILPGN
jgi:hypothetical protein